MDIKKQLGLLVEAIDTAKHILVVQADNPDADSVASALALEHILGDQGKKVTLFCAVDIPGYLRYIPGADRVTNDLPNNFDMAILVDCSTITLLEKLEQNRQLGSFKSRPFFVLDHHDSETNIPFDNVMINDVQAVSTGELIFRIAQEASWNVSLDAAELLATSILADSLGLTVESVTSNSVRTLADLLDLGVSLAKLEERRRRGMTKPLPIITYKGQLLQRIEYYADNQLAIVSIPWKEIEQYSPMYNPSVLALEELRYAESVRLSVALKSYPDGKITGKLRSNFGSAIAGELAAHFGGGGHASAAGFKTFGWNLDELKKELIAQTTKLLDQEQA